MSVNTTAATTCTVTTPAHPFGLDRPTDAVLDTLLKNGLSRKDQRLIRSGRGLSELFNIDGTIRPFYVYTGRGPSQSTLHIGHLPGLQLAKAMQQLSKRRLFFMLSDDEKSLRDGTPLSDVTAKAEATVVQLTSLGFNPENMHVHLNSLGMTTDFYRTVIQISASITPNQILHTFGEKASIGEMFYPVIQMAPCFSQALPVEFSETLGTSVRPLCVVIAGEDQDAFFRVARDVARKLGLPFPIIIYTENVPGLDGSEKMSTSVPATHPIFLTDSIKQIATAVNCIAIVGAGSTEELFARGSDLKRDIPFRIFSMFCTDEILVADVAAAYTRGLPLDDEKTADSVGRINACIAEVTSVTMAKPISTKLQNIGRQFIGSRSMRDLLISILVRTIHH